MVIRKGHVGMSFYIIYSGQVSFSLQDDEQKCDKPSEHYNLYPGDGFGVSTKKFEQKGILEIFL